MKNWKKMSADHLAVICSAGDLLSSDVFCTEGRFFPEGTFMASLFTVTVCGGHVLCDSGCYFKYLNKKKDGQEDKQYDKKC